MTFLGDQVCDACGVPFDMPVARPALCASCLRRRPLFERARAVFVYEDASRGLILKFKHGDRTDGAPAFGRWLARAGADLIRDADVIAPVPLHWTRLWRRRYNQAALLAQAMVKTYGAQQAIESEKPVVLDLLQRHRRTPSQGGLSYRGRQRNVQGAFRPGKRMRARVMGKRVLLIDDVYTTGATAEACARTLLRAGAAAVDFLTLARVVRPPQDG